MTNTKKYRFIIVEGPDCSGKSTLVERLKNTLRWDSKYLRHAEGNQFFRYLKEYATQDSTIFDRSHFSEDVYSLMWRGGSPFSFKEKRILDEVVTSHGLVIFCLPSVTDMKERYQKRVFRQQIEIEELERSNELFINESKTVDMIAYHSSNYEELEELLMKVKGIVL